MAGAGRWPVAGGYLCYSGSGIAAGAGAVIVRLYIAYILALRAPSAVKEELQIDKLRDEKSIKKVLEGQGRCK